jgi:hypothetical protein
MKTQPNRNYKSNDRIMTPLYLAELIVNYFNPKGIILEPCKGTENFLKCLPANTLWCEIDEGKDFFIFKEKVNWIITNPPWSKIRDFLYHSMELSNNIVFLMTINHLWTKARLRDMKQMNFGIKEILMIPEKTEDFPQTGFRCAAIHIQKNYKGKIKLSELIIK